ncbi:MAG: hypothetical protein RB191_02290 [Terriglobia bacterium]|nr:hypothetical protein [Terriglobia bacterium]
MMKVNGVGVRGCETARAVEVGLFDGEEWQGSVKLGRTKALQFHTALEESIREKWPNALAPPGWREREASMRDAAAAALRWIEQHRDEGESPEEREERESLIEELRAI